MKDNPSFEEEIVLSEAREKRPWDEVGKNYHGAWGRVHHVY